MRISRKLGRLGRPAMLALLSLTSRAEPPSATRAAPNAPRLTELERRFELFQSIENKRKYDADILHAARTHLAAARMNAKGAPNANRAKLYDQALDAAEFELSRIERSIDPSGLKNLRELEDWTRYLRNQIGHLEKTPGLGASYRKILESYKKEAELSEAIRLTAYRELESRGGSYKIAKASGDHAISRLAQARFYSNEAERHQKQFELRRLNLDTRARRVARLEARIGAIEAMATKAFPGQDLGAFLLSLPRWKKAISDEKAELRGLQPGSDGLGDFKGYRVLPEERDIESAAAELSQRVELKAAAEKRREPVRALKTEVDQFFSSGQVKPSMIPIIERHRRNARDLLERQGKLEKGAGLSSDCPHAFEIEALDVEIAQQRKNLERMRQEVASGSLGLAAERAELAEIRGMSAHLRTNLTRLSRLSESAIDPADLVRIQKNLDAAEKQAEGLTFERADNASQFAVQQNRLSQYRTAIIGGHLETHNASDRAGGRLRRAHAWFGVDPEVRKALRKYLVPTRFEDMAADPRFVSLYESTCGEPDCFKAEAATPGGRERILDLWAARKYQMMTFRERVNLTCVAAMFIHEGLWPEVEQLIGGIFPGHGEEGIASLGLQPGKDRETLARFLKDKNFHSGFFADNPKHRAWGMRSSRGGAALHFEQGKDKNGQPTYLSVHIDYYNPETRNWTHGGQFVKWIPEGIDAGIHLVNDDDTPVNDGWSGRRFQTHIGTRMANIPSGAINGCGMASADWEKVLDPNKPGSPTAPRPPPAAKKHAK